MTKKKSVETQLESLSEQLEEKLKKQHKEQVFAENANLMFEHNLMAFKNYFPEIYDKFLNYEIIRGTIPETNKIFFLNISNL